MIPFRNLAETTTPDGSRFSLHEHDGEFFLKHNGRQLMGSNSTVSEIRLAEVACAFRVPVDSPSILVGGLGLGFSLKRVLELTSKTASVTVAELLPEVVEWNHKFLSGLNGKLLNDKRVIIHTGDIYDCIVRGPARFDAILLDVDNGPSSFVVPHNSRIYKRSGLSLIRRALRPGGRVAFWAAEPDPTFLMHLSQGGFETKEVHTKSHERAKRAAHRIYVGEMLSGQGSAG